jgi:phosphotransferase system HPr (HPr) family protein
MNSIRLLVSNENGIHLRPLSAFVNTAGGFRGTKITVRNVTTNSPAKSATSALFVQGLKIKKGHEIEVTADGPQEAEALEAIREAVEGGSAKGLPDTAGATAHAGSRRPT